MDAYSGFVVSRHMGMRLPHGHAGTCMRLECWSDASWGGEEKRDLVSGFVFTIAGEVVSYSLIKQTSVALSLTEPKYIVLTHALKEQIWILCFLKEIGYDASEQNTIYCDNQSAITLENNPEHHAQTKHVSIRCSQRAAYRPTYYIFLTSSLYYIFL
jgi:hypothetical protein